MSRNALSDTATEARELVQELERTYAGDRDKISTHLSKMHTNAEAESAQHRIPAQLKIEIAQAYLDVSDGKGGVNRNRTGASNDPKLNRYDAAAKGFLSDNKTYSASMREAITLGLPHLMTPEVQRRNGLHHGPRQESVRVSMETEAARSVRGGHGRPSRGFAMIEALAATATALAFSIPALRYLGVDMKAEAPAIRMTSLSDAASGLNSGEATRIQANMKTPGMRDFAARAKPPTSSGPQ